MVNSYFVLLSTGNDTITDPTINATDSDNNTIVIGK